MNHPQRFVVVGFFDQWFKWAGDWQVVYFRPEDKLYSDHLPSKTQLNDYIKTKGYKRPGWRYRQDEANPIYELIGDGFEYLQCNECWHEDRTVIDNIKR